MTTNPDSAVSRVANLAEGESYCQARLIPHRLATPDRIRRAKRALLSTLSPVLSRARERNPGRYTMHGIHSFTKDYDVVVAALIVREFEDL